jgi:hypothetical protein
LTIIFWFSPPVKSGSSVSFGIKWLQPYPDRSCGKLNCGPPYRVQRQSPLNQLTIGSLTNFLSYQKLLTPFLIGVKLNKIWIQYYSIHFSYSHFVKNIYIHIYIYVDNNLCVFKYSYSYSLIVWIKKCLSC